MIRLCTAADDDGVIVDAPIDIAFIDSKGGVSDNTSRVLRPNDRLAQRSED